MIRATNLKNGKAFLHYKKPYLVLKYSLIKLGRGSAYVKINARNLETGGVEDISYQSNATVEDADTSKRKLQFLYKDEKGIYFMDTATYEQVEINAKVLGDQVYFLKEGESVDVLFWGEKALSVDLPPKVILKIVQTDPGVKGNSATNIYKPAVLENGLKLKVPLFIKVGESVRVDTRSGEYLERAR
ncbi:elongation factor P [Patescibacteria group bacterium]